MIKIEHITITPQILATTLSPLSLQIVELAQAHGRITISELEQLTKANRNTLKAHLRQLVMNKQLLLCGKGRNTWYVLI